MKLTAENHAQLEDLIDKILVTLDAGEVSQNFVKGALMYLVRIAAEDEGAELKSWLEKPETFTSWQQSAAS